MRLVASSAVGLMPWVCEPHLAWAPAPGLASLAACLQHLTTLLSLDARRLALALRWCRVCMGPPA